MYNISGYAWFSRNIIIRYVEPYSVSLANMAVFSELQGGPHDHTVAIMTTITEEVRQYQTQVVANVRRLAASLIKLGYKVVTGGTGRHLVLVDMKKSEANVKISNFNVFKNGLINSR